MALLNVDEREGRALLEEIRVLREEALNAQGLVGLVKADRDALQGFRRGEPVADEQNGTVRVRDDLVRDGAEDQAVDRPLPCVPMTSMSASSLSAAATIVWAGAPTP